MRLRGGARALSATPPGRPRQPAPPGGAGSGPRAGDARDRHPCAAAERTAFSSPPLLGLARTRTAPAVAIPSDAAPSSCRPRPTRSAEAGFPDEDDPGGRGTGVRPAAPSFRSPAPGLSGDPPRPLAALALRPHSPLPSLRAIARCPDNGCARYAEIAEGERGGRRGHPKLPERPERAEDGRECSRGAQGRSLRAPPRPCELCGPAGHFLPVAAAVYSQQRQLGKGS